MRSLTLPVLLGSHWMTQLSHYINFASSRQVHDSDWTDTGDLGCDAVIVLSRYHYPFRKCTFTLEPGFNFESFICHAN